MIPKSGNRFSEKIMLQRKIRPHDPDVTQSLAYAGQTRRLQPIAALHLSRARERTAAQRPGEGKCFQSHDPSKPLMRRCRETTHRHIPARLRDQTKGLVQSNLCAAGLTRHQSSFEMQFLGASRYQSGFPILRGEGKVNDFQNRKFPRLEERRRLYYVENLWN
jgi:hypothetical protein